MAWIEAHESLPDHPKTIETAAKLKMDKDMLVGKLWRLWTWALNNRASGFIPYVDMSTVAEKMRWTKKPTILFGALCIVPDGYQHGFLYEVDGGYMIHDWGVYTKRYYSSEVTKSKDRERKRKASGTTKEIHRVSRGIPEEMQPKQVGNSTGIPTEENRNSTCYRNLNQEEDACAREETLEDENGNPLPDPAWQQVADCYLHEIGMLPGGTSDSDLMDFTDRMGADAVCEAIRATNRENADHPWSLLKTILRDWEAKGVHSGEEALAALKDHERKKAGRYRSQAPPESAPNPYMKKLF